MMTAMNPLEHRHRNAHPDDDGLFTGPSLLRLQAAVDELCWLFNRGYARHSAIKLVGDHHQLVKRQRLAIGRAACSDDSKNARLAKCVELNDIKGQPLLIDGFNLIITLEAAIAGAVLLRCRDHCIRDLASVHGTYHQVGETETAITLIGRTLAEFQPRSVHWLFDKPISNSGRLANLVRRVGEKMTGIGRRNCSSIRTGRLRPAPRSPSPPIRRYSMPSIIG
nr:DUF434 domain-containing protein [Methylomarinum sp. Ch1-1]MDP4522539.1 DUF434 domain-containing protein [Methylomarinum sp. Ch1-1]